jgi:hypothetical protein
MGAVHRMLILGACALLVSSGCETLSDSTPNTQLTPREVLLSSSISPQAEPINRQPTTARSAHPQLNFEGITTVVALTSAPDSPLLSKEPLESTPNHTDGLSSAQPSRIVATPTSAPFASNEGKGARPTLRNAVRVVEATPVQVQPPVTGTAMTSVEPVDPSPVQPVTWTSSSRVDPLPPSVRIPQRPPIVVAERENEPQ